ncbi:2-carboxy-1,4-naphthoquinone phytyltransferase [Gloeobacter kilaueensis]|uniref:2-carboxy-1,4-naphthoquinone phytyltransferase n=1 Tax=Gloeobacter kilaueensis (strain ATCC BAA-2537 / CCAP 1431/1 / ULC 316 / JS1) TaxID=1183438 RepID=U5QIA2_GLOK1|nr:2-carboxy-1,4-naphthoquinone phytyltransferase [Gloeobacter kilaueensis]AGY58623.1 1,4-dihydroxy-2-naphthoate octaprenyltransferase [Gloeobacter kilaueensis JS1]
MASSPLKPWLNSFNPLIYTASVVPVLVGTAFAWWHSGEFNPGRFALCLAGLVCVHGWINLSNDVFDWDTGVDRNKLNSLVRTTGSRSQVLWVGNALLSLGYLCFWLLQDWWLLLFGSFGIFLGYAYQGPPFRLAYKGWGEWISSSCFGPIAVLTACRAQTGSWEVGALLAGVAVGSWTATILYAHHFPQCADDREFDKRTPIVRWGPQLAARRFWWVIAPAYAVLGLGVVTRYLPWTVLACLLTLPLALSLLRFVRANATDPPVVGAALPMAARFHLVNGLLLALALALAP